MHISVTVGYKDQIIENAILNKVNDDVEVNRAHKENKSLENGSKSHKQKFNWLHFRF